LLDACIHAACVAMVCVCMYSLVQLEPIVIGTTSSNLLALAADGPECVL
jgi:hypothetical protein